MTKITFIGDIMCKEEMLKPAQRNGDYDFTNCFVHCRQLFAQSDAVIGNLETPISINDEKLVCEKYSFNAPYEFGQAVYSAGINIVSTANNHCLDRGVEGIKSTVESLNKIGFLHTGIAKDKSEKPYLIIDVNGMRLGILSYTYGTNADSNHVYIKKKDEWMVNLFQNQENYNIVTRYCQQHKSKVISKIYNKIWLILHPELVAKSRCEIPQKSNHKKRRVIDTIHHLKSEEVDMMIMCLHIGGQYNTRPTRYTKDITAFLRKQGVDFVICNHEHRVQSCDVSRLTDGKFTTYALGNFLGVGGTLQEPYDKLANYSIACHAYFSDEKLVQKITFSVLKTIEEDNTVTTYPVYDLMNILDEPFEQYELWEETKKTVRTFSGMDISKTGFLQEYILYERVSE